MLLLLLGAVFTGTAIRIFKRKGGILVLVLVLFGHGEVHEFDGGPVLCGLDVGGARVRLTDGSCCGHDVGIVRVGFVREGRVGSVW